MTVNPLLDYLFDRGAQSLRSPVAAWLADSPRFAAFVETYKDKIRKKIRVAKGEEMALDLLAELETAYLLLTEKRFELAYEPYASQKKRGPDFAVTWRTNLTFNVEVTRLRPAGGEVEARLSDTVCEKLGQMLPGMINVLAVVSRDPLPAPDLSAALQRLKLAAEKRDPVLYARHGYQAPADFFKGFERLSALLWRGAGGGPPVLWDNPQARQPLPGKVGKLLVG